MSDQLHADLADALHILGFEWEYLGESSLGWMPNFRLSARGGAYIYAPYLAGRMALARRHGGIQGQPRPDGRRGRPPRVRLPVVPVGGAGQRRPAGGLRLRRGVERHADRSRRRDAPAWMVVAGEPLVVRPAPLPDCGHELILDVNAPGG